MLQRINVGSVRVRGMLLYIFIRISQIPGYIVFISYGFAIERKCRSASENIRLVIADGFYG